MESEHDTQYSDLSKRLTYSHLPGRRPLCWRRRCSPRLATDRSRVFALSTLLPMLPGLGGGGRDGEERGDSKYILEVELLGKMHHDRSLKEPITMHPGHICPLPLRRLELIA